MRSGQCTRGSSVQNNAKARTRRCATRPPLRLPLRRISLRKMSSATNTTCESRRGPHDRSYSWQRVTPTSCTACTTLANVDIVSSHYCIDLRTYHCKPLEERCNGYDDACRLTCEVGCWTPSIRLCAYASPSPPAFPMPSASSPALVMVPRTPPSPTPPHVRPLRPPTYPQALTFDTRQRLQLVLAGRRTSTLVVGVSSALVLLLLFALAFASIRRWRPWWQQAAHAPALVPTSADIPSLDYVDGGAFDVNVDVDVGIELTDGKGHAASTLHPTSHASLLAQPHQPPSLRELPPQSSTVDSTDPTSECADPSERSSVGFDFQELFAMDHEHPISPSTRQAALAAAATAVAAAPRAEGGHACETSWLAHFGLATDGARELWLRTASAAVSAGSVVGSVFERSAHELRPSEQSAGTRGPSVRTNTASGTRGEALEIDLHCNDEWDEILHSRPPRARDVGRVWMDDETDEGGGKTREAYRKSSLAHHSLD